MSPMNEQCNAAEALENTPDFGDLLSGVKGECSSRLGMLQQKQALMSQVEGHKNGAKKGVEQRERISKDEAIRILLNSKYLLGAEDCNNPRGCGLYDCASLVQWYTKFVTGVDVTGNTKTLFDNKMGNLEVLNKDNIIKVWKEKGAYHSRTDTSQLQNGDIFFFGADANYKKKGYPVHVVVYVDGQFLSAQDTKTGIKFFQLDVFKDKKYDYRGQQCLGIYRPKK